MSYETIQFTIDSGIATLTLNRPERLNSFTQAMHLEVRAALSPQIRRPHRFPSRRSRRDLEPRRCGALLEQFLELGRRGRPRPSRTDDQMGDRESFLIAEDPDLLQSRGLGLGQRKRDPFPAVGLLGPQVLRMDFLERQIRQLHGHARRLAGFIGGFLLRFGIDALQVAGLKGEREDFEAAAAVVAWGTFAIAGDAYVDVRCGDYSGN